jgi:hypothetical protein
MRVPNWILEPITTRLRNRAARRAPDFLIGGSENPYMRRWWIIPRNKKFNIYLHHFLRSDDDRALHDHPWWNVSILLSRGYVEHTIAAGGVNRATFYPEGAVKFRFASAAHRIDLINGPCWSLFITGPIIREWGFHCPKAWRHWKIFVNDKDRGQIGVGCDDLS